MTTSRLQRFALLAGGFLGLVAVALGAFGAHGLAALLAEKGTTHSWETAARYNTYHALALLALAAIAAIPGVSTTVLTWVARLWTVGTLLFAGSLYWYAVGGPHPLVFVTPVGGVVLLTGWACLVVAALKTTTRE
jgi:uncharacterized membrane protein YgdD (TMEM256/DUF423 family)